LPISRGVDAAERKRLGPAACSGDTAPQLNIDVNAIAIALTTMHKADAILYAEPVAEQSAAMGIPSEDLAAKSEEPRGDRHHRGRRRDDRSGALARRGGRHPAPLKQCT
jgi:hypothetical protein